MKNRIPLSHPGKILLTEFMEPLKISQYRLAKDIGVAARRINEIVHGKRSISPDTALRLARYFQMSERFFTNLQADYDLRIAKREMAEDILSGITPFPMPASGHGLHP